MEDLIRQAYQRSIELLKSNATAYGFQAAPVNPVKPSYSYLFGRDTSICALAVLDHPDPELAKAAVISLDTLRQARSVVGQVPFRANPQTGYRDFWFPGNLDSTLWWALASLRLAAIHPQLASSWQADIESSIVWLRHQDAAETGLLMQGQRSDWADEMPSHGAVLYSNALWYLVLQNYKQVYKHSTHPVIASLTDSYVDAFRRHFTTVFWPYDDQRQQVDALDNKAVQRAIEWVRTDLVQQPYFVQYVSRRAYGWRCDLFANTLTLLTDLPSDDQRQAVEQHLIGLQATDICPGRTLHPVVYPGDQDWQQAMIARHQNIPYQYHNGGIWPYIGGFWVSYLAGRSSHKALAHQQLHQLAQAAALNDWQFNEYFNGQNGQPMGIHRQSWNAAMYIAAYQAIHEYKPLFGLQASSQSLTNSATAVPAP